jgi:hypothetical protein
VHSWWKVDCHPTSCSIILTRYLSAVEMLKLSVPAVGAPFGGYRPFGAVVEFHLIVWSQLFVGWRLYLLTENLELCRKPRRSPHSDSSFAERSPRSASKSSIEATRNQKDKGTTKLSFLSNQASDIIGNSTPHKHTHTHTHTTLFTHSFIHHRLVLIGLRLLSARFLLVHLPLLTCALLAQKRAEERRIHIINHFVHTTTQNKTSLSLSLSSSSLQSLDPISCPLD